MNKYIYWTVGVLVTLLLLGGGYFFVAFKYNNTTPTPSSNPLPQAGSGGTSGSPMPSTNTGTPTNPPLQKISITAQSGTAIAVNDFIHNGITYADIENPGYYYVAGSPGYCLANGSCPGGAATNDFTIIYRDANHAFNIFLLTEPISAGRQAAEQFLMNQLGISQNQMCYLQYYVSTSNDVNQFYAGKNLGFSFCPGATKL